MVKRGAAAVLAVCLFISFITGCGAADTETYEAGTGQEGTSSADTGSDESSSPADKDDENSGKPAGGDEEAPEEEADSGSGQNGSEEDGSSSSVITAPGLTHPIDSLDGTMRLSLPENWSDIAGSLEAGGLSASEMDRRYPLKAACYEEASFLIGSHEKKDGSPIADLRDYMDTLYNGFSRNGAFTDIQNGQDSEITLKKSGLTALRRDFTASFAGKNVVCRLYAVESGHSFYQLMAWTLGSNIRTGEVTFDAIADSLELIGET